MENEKVTITLKEYQRLLARDEHLSFLECRGVDNWQGFGCPPDRDDYDSDEEYEVAFEEAVGNY